MKGTVKSEKGFYIGDICYVLGDKRYHGIWGAQGYTDGEFTDTETGLKFAVAGTAYGDGSYEGSNGVYYSVDAGVIGIVPLELVEKAADYLDLGSVHFCAGLATMEAENGEFSFSLPNCELITIHTGDDETDDDEELQWWQK